jgi:hypothetical protein
MITFQTHPNLYVRNYEESLQYAKRLSPFRTPSPMKFHLYWRVPNDVTVKHLTCLKSIVANHEELNSGNYEINLWSNVDLSQDETLKPVSPYVTHRIWDPIQEMKGTPLEDHMDYFKSVATDDSLCWLGIDLFKILCLYKYGGFFIDMDVLVLRDMSPLNSTNFIYQWGECGANPNAPNPMGGAPTKEMLCNGAVMRLDENSVTAFRFLEQLRYIPPTPNSVCWGCYLYSKVVDPHLYKLPCAWFNLELLGNGTKHGCWAFDPDDAYEPYDGCFAWHWHGARKWNAEIKEGSKFHHLMSIIDQKFASLTST